MQPQRPLALLLETLGLTVGPLDLVPGTRVARWGKGEAAKARRAPGDPAQESRWLSGSMP